jgi:hypothetical protein
MSDHIEALREIRDGVAFGATPTSVGIAAIDAVEALVEALRNSRERFINLGCSTEIIDCALAVYGNAYQPAPLVGMDEAELEQAA